MGENENSRIHKLDRTYHDSTPYTRTISYVVVKISVHIFIHYHIGYLKHIIRIETSSTPKIWGPFHRIILRLIVQLALRSVVRKTASVFHGRFVSCIPCRKSVFDLNCNFTSLHTHTHTMLYPIFGFVIYSIQVFL